ncbi:hypothetical protein K491DRAFT_284274 [Lophiostoma macrostomum CBS 122681]|uniref:Secreted protein n=1 Tax=Lophiostoma macrostomum CBS 122681 TaxID=1314788 RepID=A0A6A6TR00_9PLEO|nr:hypothetical protein K491DRAFT_284274 [Lophiostoma macrostomum CBS 122681]
MPIIPLAAVVTLVYISSCMFERCVQPGSRMIEDAPQGRQPVSTRLRRSRDHVQGSYLVVPRTVLTSLWGRAGQFACALILPCYPPSFLGRSDAAVWAPRGRVPFRMKSQGKSPPRDLALQHLITKNSPRDVELYAVPGTHRIVLGKRPICTWSATPELPVPSLVQIRIRTAAT